MTDPAAPHCPLPFEPDGQIRLADGGGGRAMHRLINDLFVPAFAPLGLDAQHDGATLPWPGGRLAFTTDAFVVRPLEFPGGDIGTLAVNGTVNDLAMCGATPIALSAAFIIEEGLARDTLARVVASMASAASAAGVSLVTGDTKVIDRQAGGELMITTSGVGSVPDGRQPGPAAIRPGDAIILSGDIARHGMAVMTVRDGLSFDSDITSDCAPLHRDVQAVYAAADVHALRDCTRGGMAAALHELATACNFAFHIDDAAIPVDDTVRAACELLGIDPLYVACEGRFVAIVATADAAQVPGIRIGTVLDEPASPPLRLQLPWGTTRVIDLPAGEQLPRIC